MAGIAGTVAACVWGAIAYKNRGPAMTTSRYLMRLRVIAQSCVVGSIIAGIGVTALQEKLEAKAAEKKEWSQCHFVLDGLKRDNCYWVKG